MVKILFLQEWKLECKKKFYVNLPLFLKSHQVRETWQVMSCSLKSEKVINLKEKSWLIEIKRIP